jgi:DNA-binding response OmpR family regulator
VVRPTVLIAEHSPLVAGQIASAFRSAGFDVAAIVNDGISAVEQARALQPTVITVDLIMPRFSGLKVVESLGAACPAVVVVTAITARARVAEAKAAGASYYVLKPIDHDKLTAAAAALARAAVSARGLAL